MNGLTLQSRLQVGSHQLQQKLQVETVASTQASQDSNLIFITNLP